MRSYATVCGVAALDLTGLFPAAVLARASEWMWTFTPYSWSSDLNLNVQINDQEVIDQLGLFHSARLEGQRGKLGLEVGEQDEGGGR